MARGTINLERDLAGCHVAVRILRYADDVAARLLGSGAAVPGGTGFRLADDDVLWSRCLGVGAERRVSVAIYPIRLHRRNVATFAIRLVIGRYLLLGGWIKLCPTPTITPQRIRWKAFVCILDHQKPRFGLIGPERVTGCMFGANGQRDFLDQHGAIKESAGLVEVNHVNGACIDGVDVCHSAITRDRPGPNEHKPAWEIGRKPDVSCFADERRVRVQFRLYGVTLFASPCAKQCGDRDNAPRCHPRTDSAHATRPHFVPARSPSREEGSP